MADDTHNKISGGIFFSAVIQGRNIAVQLPPHVTPALSGLPAGSAAFTGRDRDLRAVLEQLAPRPPGDGDDGERPVTSASPTVLVTALGGLAGIGKTELAVQATHTALARGWFPGGVLFADLFGYDITRRIDPSQALEGWLRALGIPAEHIPPDVQDRARLYTSVLANYARHGRRILVVIDNAATHEQVQPLIPTDGTSAAVITSRHTLGMLDACLLDLDVLSTGNSVRLLAGALQMTRPGDTRIADRPGDAARIAELCGGLPLALRIIAALLSDDPARPLSAMASDLADEGSRLEEMEYGTTAMRAAFDLSYQHLDSEQARLFRLLPMNPGPEISTEATAFLAGVERAAARRRLEALARAHLIDHGSATGRWRMHDLIRLYADRHGRGLAESDDRAHAFTRLLRYYLTTASDASEHLSSVVDSPAARFGDRAQALTWLDSEYPNLNAAIRAAHRDSDFSATFQMTLALGGYLTWRRHDSDMIILCTLALDAARQLGERRGEAFMLTNLGIALTFARMLDEAITHHQDAVRIFKEIGDRHVEAAALGNLGNALEEAGRFNEAIPVHQDAGLILLEIGDQYSAATELINLGCALRMLRQFDQAIAALHDAARILKEIDGRHGEGKALNNLGATFSEAAVGRFEEAIIAHQHALAIYRETGDKHGEAMALNGLGYALGQAMRFDEAVTILHDAVAVHREVGDKHNEAIAMANLEAARRAQRSTGKP